jgi:hypothetical protein
MTKDIYDTVFMAQARAKTLLIDEILKIIENLGFDNLTVIEQARVRRFLLKLVNGMESAQEGLRFRQMSVSIYRNIENFCFSNMKTTFFKKNFRFMIFSAKF